MKVRPTTFEDLALSQLIDKDGNTPSFSQVFKKDKTLLVNALPFDPVKHSQRYQRYVVTIVEAYRGTQKGFVVLAPEAYA